MWDLGELLGSGIMDLCSPGRCREMHGAVGWLAYLYFRQNFPHFLCLKHLPAWFWAVQKHRLSPEELDLLFVLIPSWVSSQQPDCRGHCAPEMDAGCVPGSWQAPEHPLLESQHGFGGKSGVTRQSLASCPCREEPILGTCPWNGGCQAWLGPCLSS